MNESFPLRKTGQKSVPFLINTLSFHRQWTGVRLFYPDYHLFAYDFTIVKEYGYENTRSIDPIIRRKIRRTKKWVTKNFVTHWFSVVPTGVVSNFLLEDFEAVLKFMNAEMQKKKRFIRIGV